MLSNLILHKSTKLELIMKKTYIQLLILSALFIGFLNGCKEDTVFTPIIEGTDAEQTSSKNSSETQWMSADAFYYMSAIACGLSDFNGNCPVVTVDSVSITGGKTYTITVDYGTTPCQSPKRNIRASGKYIVAGFINTSRDSIYAGITLPASNPLKFYKIANSADTNFVTVSAINLSANEVYGRKVSAIDNSFTGKFNSGIIFTTSTGIIKSIAMNLTVNATLGSLSTLSDDSYILKGTGSIKDNRYSVQFAYTIQDSLTVTGNCRYPVRGKAAWVRSGSGITTTYVDFYPSSGNCDDVVTITRGTISKTVNLDTTDQ
jgi:hypothetical protein